MNSRCELWIADITYIRLETEFVYLAVVLDAFSRRVTGWELDRTLEDDLAITAQQMAFDQRKPRAGLTHHSHRGVQYASHDYTALLKDHGVTISISRKGNLDLPPKLRQTVKSQNSANGEFDSWEYLEESSRKK